MEARELGRGGKRLALGGLSALLGAIRLEPQRRSAQFQQPARRSPFRPPPLRGDRTRGGAAERQGAPAAARVDRVLQLVDPSAQRRLLLQQDAQVGRVRRSLRCRLTSKFKGEPGESLLVLLPRLGHLEVAAACAAAGHRGRPPRRRRLDGPRRQRGTRRSAGRSLLDAYRRAAAGLGRGGVRTSPCASVALPGGRRCLDQPLRPWPLVGVHFVKGAATEVVATAEVRASVTVATEARAAVRVEAKVTATEVVRATACEEMQAWSRPSASASLTSPNRDTYRDHVNTGLRSSD